MNRLQRICAQLAPAGANAQLTSAGTSGYKKPLNVLVTGGAGNIAYSLLFMIANGDMCPGQPINLRILDIPGMENNLEGVAMEINDCAYPLVQSMVTTTDYEVAFKNLDVAFLVGAKPRGPGMVRADLLKANAKIFEGQGQALDKYASKDVKVVVVGNPANTNALILMTYAPSIPRENITAMTRLDQNRAAGSLATKMGVNVSNISGTTIWGNHSATQYPDVNHAKIAGKPYPLQSAPLRDVVGDDAWLNGDFITKVQKRGAAIIKARGKSSAASAAKSSVDHMREWLCGTPAGHVSSMGVISDGNPYGVPAGIMYSFPCVCTNGTWAIVGGLPIDSFSQAKMDATAQELLGEKKMALGQ